jgi:Na+-driven multidrug efflux pump
MEMGDGIRFLDEGRVTKKLPEGVKSQMLYKDIVRIAWPSFIELTLSQAASFVDLMMVGALGSYAITSVGLSTQPRFIMLSLIMAMNVGATTLVAQARGAGNPERARLVLRQALLITFIVSAVLSTAGFFSAKSLISFMGAADDETLLGGTIYLKIQMVGLMSFALTSTISAALRGVGNTRATMNYNMTSNIVNVVFNYLLIYGNFGFPRMGVAGASLATVIGQIAALGQAFYAVLADKQYMYIDFKKGFRPDKSILKDLFKIGSPSMVEQFALRMGLLMYAKTVASLWAIEGTIFRSVKNLQNSALPESSGAKLHLLMLPSPNSYSLSYSSLWGSLMYLGSCAPLWLWAKYGPSMWEPKMFGPSLLSMAFLIFKTAVSICAGDAVISVGKIEVVP